MIRLALKKNRSFSAVNSIFERSNPQLSKQDLYARIMKNKDEKLLECKKEAESKEENYQSKIEEIVRSHNLEVAAVKN